MKFSLPRIASSALGTVTCNVAQLATVVARDFGVVRRRVVRIENPFLLALHLVQGGGTTWRHGTVEALTWIEAALLI